jgi:hypothetical protein
MHKIICEFLLQTRAAKIDNLDKETNNNCQALSVLSKLSTLTLIPFLFHALFKDASGYNSPISADIIESVKWGLM